MNSPAKNPAENVFILGRKYTLPQDADSIDRFLESRIWFSYRTGMEPIAYKFSTDAGWGCMLRCGQMLLAQCLLMRHLGPDFLPPGGARSYLKYREILSWFLDIPYMPYSIHRIAERGTQFDKKVGDWFGPTTIAQVLKCLVAEHQESGIAVHTAMDGVVYLQDILRISELVSDCQTPLPIPDPFPSPIPASSSRFASCSASSSPSAPAAGRKQRARAKRACSWKPLLLIIPLRLGLDSINSVYISQLKDMFTYPQTVGIIGGKPNAAYYFVGTKDDSVFYLDPHTTFPAVDRSELAQFHTSSYHCKRTKLMRISDMDTSLALGFYFEKKSDFDDFCFHTRHAMTESDTPLFTVMEKQTSTANLTISTRDFTANHLEEGAFTDGDYEIL